MKRILAILLLTALLVAAVPAVAFASSSSTKGTTVYRVKTSGGNLNVRAKASATAKVVKSVKNGTPFIVLKTSGKWYRVKSMKGMTGWVYKKYVKAGAYAIVSTKESGLNIRKTINGKILGSAPKNAKVLVQYISGDWANVLYQKLDGWSYRSYLTWVA